MAQVKTLDTAYLKAQDPDQHASLASGAVAIVDGDAPAYGPLKELLAERIRSIPRCTQLLRTQNFEWIDYPEFDVAHHVRRVAIPRPGDEAQLSQAIAYALERPLDLDRPPWECWVIEGLKGNRWAMLMKTHHGVADAAHLLARLCDAAGGDTFANHVGAAQVSSEPRPGWADALGRAAAVAGTMVGGMWPTERLSAEPVMRRYGTVRVPVADVDKVCRKFGVTVNDVALAAITEGFRRVLLCRGEQPRADSLRTLVPTPVRSAMLPYLPVEHDDPVQQLRTVHDRWKVQKVQQAGKRQPGLVESALNCLPTMLRSNVLQMLTRLPHAAIVTLGTHAPGPRHQLRLMGQTMERLLPIPPTAVALSTGVAVLSYGDELVFGITAEYDAAADVRQLAAGIELGMAQMVALSQDSVLLFSKDHRRKRAARTHPSQSQRVWPSAPY